MSAPADYSPLTHATASKAHGSWVLLSSTVADMVAILFMYLRIGVLCIHPSLIGPPTYALAIYIAQVSAVIQCLLVLGSGLGNVGTADFVPGPNWQQRTEKLLYASDLFFLLSIAASRAAVSCFQCVKRLTACSILLGIVSLFMVGFGCNVRSPWSQSTLLCDSLYWRWYATVLFSNLLEAVIFLEAIIPIKRMQAERKTKIKAAVVFGLRLTIVVISICRVNALIHLNATSDSLRDRVHVVIWQQFEQTYSVVTASLVALMPFLENTFTTSTGSQQNVHNPNTTNEESGNNLAMRPLARREHEVGQPRRSRWARWLAPRRHEV